MWKGPRFVSQDLLVGAMCASVPFLCDQQRLEIDCSVRTLLRVPVSLYLRLPISISLMEEINK